MLNQVFNSDNYAHLQPRDVSSAKRAWNFKDISGQKFGRLTAIECLGHRYHSCGNKNSLWRCKCDCGKEVVVSRPTIRHFIANGSKPTGKWGCVPSCGCSYLDGLKIPRPEYKFRNPRQPGQTGKNCLWKTYTGAARSRGLEWGLTKDQFIEITSKDCHYCGCSASKIYRSMGEDRGQDYAYNGIDRMDNSKGYVDGNVLPCCSICNHAKHVMNYDDFISWINRIVNFRK